MFWAPWGPDTKACSPTPMAAVFFPFGYIRPTVELLSVIKKLFTKAYRGSYRTRISATAEIARDADVAAHVA